MGALQRIGIALTILFGRNDTIVSLSGSPEAVERVKGLLALLHLSSAWGHSGIFGMPLDGDGPERLEVRGLDMGRYRRGAEHVTGVGYGLETSQDGGFSGWFLDRDRPRKWGFDHDGKAVE